MYVLGSLEINAAYLTTEAERVKGVERYDDCEAKCREADYCATWTHLPAGKVCLLLSAAAAAAKKTPLDGAISSHKQHNDKQQNSCLTPGLKYKNPYMVRDHIIRV